MPRLLGLSSVAVLLSASIALATDVTLDTLKSKAPETWKSSPPANKFRAYQFSVPAASGDKEDGELIIFYFGPGGGGGVTENLKRWQNMFEAPEGKDLSSKVEKIKLDKAELTYLDVTGTYLSKFPPFDPNAKVTRKANFRRLGVYFASENGPYFITLTGPAATIERHKADFDRWLKNFK